MKGGSDKFPERAIGMQYCGSNFIADILDLKENAKRIWNKFPYPLDDTLLIRKSEGFTEISFENYSKIEEIVENAKKHLNI